MIDRTYDQSRGDIVAQLLNWEGEYHYPSGLLVAAADEIDRLRKLVRHLDNVIADLSEDLRWDERGY